MRITVGKKLGLGFAVVIALLALSTVVAYYKILNMEDSVETAVDNAFPSALTCRSLVGDIDASLAALRGYMLLGDDPANAKTFKSSRAEAWRNLDTNFSKLETLGQAWSGPELRLKLSKFGASLNEFRDVQQRVEDVAHTDEDVRPLHLMATKAVPLTETMDAAISAIAAEEAGREATPERQSMLHAFAILQHSGNHAVSELRAFLLRKGAEARQRFNQRARSHEESFRRVELQSELLTGSQRANWERYANAYEEFQPVAARLIAMRDAADWIQSNYLLATEAAPRARRLRAIMDEIVVAMNLAVAESREAITTNGKAVTTTLFGSALGAIVIAFFVAVFLSRKIVAGIQEVAVGARKIAEGDLTGSEIRRRSNDEVGELAAAFNSMRAGLKQMAEQIRDATENVNSTSAEMLASTQQQAAAAKEQAATVQEITSTLEEINQSGNQIGDRAKQVSATVEEASEATKRGMTATQETSSTMQSIRDQVEEVAENVVSVSERTQTIGEIIATVSEIAEQSNLLALNASIEAVSAGDNGGRFSVVAHEMKNLADRAKDCTVQVRTILGEIQKGINTSVMMTEEAVKRVEVGKKKATATETTIREVTSTNDGSLRAFQQIIAGTSQQQIGVGQVTQGMQDIRQAIEQTAAGTAQMEKAAANMNALSQQLKNAAAQYRV